MITLSDIMGSPYIQDKLKKLIKSNRETMYLHHRLIWKMDRYRKDDFEDRYLR